MMTLVFVTVGQQNQYREFEYDLDSFEQVIQLLNHVYRTGDALVSAYLLDGQQGLPLPIEVINGEDLTRPFRQLEQEWQARLQTHERTQTARKFQ